MVFVDENRAIVLAAAPALSLSKRVLVPNTTYAELSPSAFALSPDKKFVFLAHDSFKVRQPLHCLRCVPFAQKSLSL